MFLYNRRLRQGDSLSPVLFILYINNLAVRLSKDDNNNSINILQYADDLAIFAKSEELLQIYWIEKNYVFTSVRVILLYSMPIRARHHLCVGRSRLYINVVSNKSTELV